MKNKNKNKKDINIVEKYFSQMNFLIIDVIAVLVAAVGVVLFFLQFAPIVVTIPLILVGGIIKYVGLLKEIKDSDFDDLVNHLKEVANINYRDSQYKDKTFFEIYDVTEAPIRLGRDQLYRSNHLTISLFAFEKNECIVELYHFNIKDDTYKLEEHRLPLTSKVNVIKVPDLIEKHYSYFLTVEGNDSIKIPVKTGSMDLEQIIERFNDRK